MFLSQVIEWGFDQRLRRFDFLVGGEGSYKHDYECRTEPVPDLRLYNNTWTGQLVRSARGVRQLLRQVASRRPRLTAGAVEPMIRPTGRSACPRP